MNTVLSVLGIAAALLFVTTRLLARRVERDYPPIGRFAEIEGVQLHYTDHAADADSAVPPLVFLHGASGNLREQEAVFVDRFAGRARMIFIDRPGHGHSGRHGPGDVHEPAGQARIVAGLLERLDAGRVILIGHSYGSSVVAAFAVNHPQQTAGAVFVAPATHPWPGGRVTWYYHLTVMPVIGRLFSELFAIPAGHLRYREGVAGIFEPEKTPKRYKERSGTKLLLRPDVFRFNAHDVTSLYEIVRRFAPRYREINVPVSIISGDSDAVVLAEVHSIGLERDIAGARLVWLEGVGHAPHWTRLDAVALEIERVAAQAVARSKPSAASR